MGTFIDLRYEDQLAILTLDRPDRLNAMGNEMDGQFWDALTEIYARDDVRCVLWRAEGRAFSAGRDVNDLGNRGPGESDYHYINAGHTATHRLLVPPKLPIVCAIQGWCIGGSFERTLLCDLRIAADDAKFRLPELAHGLIPDSGGTARLFQICGPGIATDLVLTGRVMDAEEALRHGAVSRVVPRDELDAVALEAARTIASHPPLAVQAWRQACSTSPRPRSPRRCTPSSWLRCSCTSPTTSPSSARHALTAGLRSTATPSTRGRRQRLLTTPMLTALADSVGGPLGPG